jgi:hypothetical protein
MLFFVSVHSLFIDNMTSSHTPRRLFAAVNELTTAIPTRSLAATQSALRTRSPCTLSNTRPSFRSSRRAGVDATTAYSPISRSLCSSSILRKAETPTATTPPPPLPILPRPLGVQDPPSTASKTWQEKKDELLDRDRHLAKRKAL